LIRCQSSPVQALAEVEPIEAFLFGAHKVILGIGGEPPIPRLATDDVVVSDGNDYGVRLPPSAGETDLQDLMGVKGNQHAVRECRRLAW